MNAPSVRDRKDEAVRASTGWPDPKGDAKETIRVTAKDTDLSRYLKVTVPLMAPETSLELCIDDAGLERIGVVLSKACKRSCCVAPTQGMFDLEAAA